MKRKLRRRTVDYLPSLLTARSRGLFVEQSRQRKVLRLTTLSTYSPTTDSASEKQITKALMLGQFEKAMTICLKEDRIADAFIIANCGGKELLEKAQAAYLSRNAQGPTIYVCWRL